jgi:hypothetical protein
MLFFAAAGTSGKPRSFKRVCNFTPSWLLDDVSAEALLMSLMFCPHPAMGVLQDAKEEENGEDESEEEEESEDESLKKKGAQGVIEIENPNLVKIKNLKVKDVDLDRPAELSRREREEIEKQRAHERYIKLQEQGKTEQSKKDLGVCPTFYMCASLL